MLYIGMSGAKEVMLSQGLNSNNLANASTVGFRADLAQFRSMPVFGPGFPSRAYAMTERPGTNFANGPLETTGRELDVAIDGKGWLAVQAPDGTEAYTRAGDLQVTAGGFLVTGTGLQVLGNGGPIALPPAAAVNIGSDGTISIRPSGQGAAALAVVDRLRLVKPNEADVEKGRDGLFRRIDGAPAAFDPSVRVVSGSLERSNVSVVESMVKMIDLSRAYEMQVKVMKTADEVDSASDTLLRMG